ncbi:hypothetical protein F4818DRAFT_264907 [Hypoxylon cercidicola]|nr:hypothetical protein F4818DRAFT_264907 [Hypoxylon cercidicola]
MTKQWDMYEDTIKTLYSENTLSVVRQIMIDKYGFRASTRAYRGRLIRWGVRKYNCRKLSDHASSPASSVNDGAFSSESGSPSPILPSHGGNIVPPAADYDAAHHQVQVDMGRKASDGGHLAMPGRINQQYGTVVGGDHQTQAYSTDDPYGNKNKTVLSPPQSSSGVQYEWGVAPSPLTDHNSSTSNGANSLGSHANATMPPPYFGGYTQMAPPASVSSDYTATMETGYNDLPDGINNHGHSLSYYRTPPQQQGHNYDGAAG